MTLLNRDTKHQKEEWEERIKFRDTPFEIEIDGKPVDDLEQIYSLIRQTREEAKREGREEILKLADGITFEERGECVNVRDELLKFEMLLHSLSTAGN